MCRCFVLNQWFVFSDNDRLDVFGSRSPRFIVHVWDWDLKDRVWFRPSTVKAGKKVTRKTVKHTWKSAKVMMINKKKAEMLVYREKERKWGLLHMNCDTRLIRLKEHGPLASKCPMFEAPEHLVMSKRAPVVDWW